MPWFHPGLDPDLRRALESMGIASGRALDLGTGPGTQAIALAERGFAVTATDISATAIAKARRRARKKGLAIEFREDDIVRSTIEERFDLVLDRGCFHVLAPRDRTRYIRAVAPLVAPGGHLFLKCFSHRETREEGPYRFTPAQVRELFGSRFSILSIEETVYQGTLDPLPKALFCVLEKPRGRRPRGRPGSTFGRSAPAGGRPGGRRVARKVEGAAGPSRTGHRAASLLALLFLGGCTGSGESRVHRNDARIRDEGDGPLIRRPAPLGRSCWH